MKKRRLWALGLALGLCAVTLTAFGQESRPTAQGPNVILIMTDDMRMDDLAFMPYTKHLIGDRGVTFPQSLSPYPLCCPARAELMTGQYSHNNGVQGNKWPRGGYYRLNGSNTLATWLWNQGYDTALFGKYLNQFGMRDRREIPPGWGHWDALLGDVYNYTHPVLDDNGSVVHHPRIYQTRLFDHASNKLVKALGSAGRPYFMWVSYVTPHSACSYPNRGTHGCWHRPPPERPDEHSFDGLPPLTDPSINEKDMSDKGAYMRRLPLLTPEKLAARRIERIKRIEALQSVDRAVKHMVDTLKATHQYRDTYLIFTSDNGVSLGEHRWVFKVLGYEPDLLVPLLMEGPGIPAGVVRRQAVTTVDLAPTISDMTGTRPTLLEDGMSLLPLAEGKVTDSRDRVVPIEAAPIHHVAPTWLYQGVRTNRYTLLRWDNGDLELYDRQKDPYEMSSVANQPAYAGVQRYLLSELRQLRDCAGSACVRWAPPLPRR